MGNKKYSAVNNTNKQDGDLFKLPQLPSTFDEAWQKVSDFGKSTTAMITGKESKEEIKSEVIMQKIPEPDVVIQESYDTASESCNCPIGVCLGRHDQTIAQE